MAGTFTRKTFVEGSAAVGGGVALSALAAGTAHGQRARRARGYGPLRPRREQTTGRELLKLPPGFRYKVISKEQDPSTAYVTDPNTLEHTATTVPTPNVFDGMGAYPSRDGSNTTILIRNHEHRQRAGEIPVVVPDDLRYDPNPVYRGGSTKLVVDNASREVISTLHVLGGTSVNCAGGVMPWGSWITCEEIALNARETNAADATTPNEKHGWIFEVDAYTDRPVNAVPIERAGFFAHEAVAWLDGALYETEDAGFPSFFFRYRPGRTIDAPGELEGSNGVLEVLRRRGAPGFDGNTANPGDVFGVEWVRIPDPEARRATVKQQAIDRGGMRFSRLEGAWVGDGHVYFDATSGGEAQQGQLWSYRPADDTLRLIFESPGEGVLDNPDNVVVAPTGHVWLQEDGDGSQFIRGVNQAGQIYDIVESIANSSEFAGGCFSPDGQTFFVNQLGDRGVPNDQNEILDNGAVTYAIWGPFTQLRDGPNQNRRR